MIVTEPGVIDGMPDDVYHRDPVPGGSLSSSGARKLLATSPARYDHERRNPPPSTDRFDLGKAFHQLVLGGGADIHVIDAPDWRSRDARDQKAAAYAAGLTPLLAADHQRAQDMADAVRAHPIAGPLFDPVTGKAEQSLFWIDQPTGAWCRARYDFLRHRAGRGRLVIPDLKSTDAADLDSVTKSIGRYGYHQQAAFYSDAAIHLDLAADDTDIAFLLVFVEKAPPHAIRIVQVDPDDIAAGRRRNRQALEVFAECQATGHWPGYPTDIELVSLPPYHQ